MATAASDIPTGPIQGHAWSIEPITHTLHAQSPCYSLRVRTGFLRFALTFMLSGLLFFPFSFIIRDGDFALGIAVLAAFGLATFILRWYRRQFLEICFDTARQMVELSQHGCIQEVPFGHITCIQICRCLDRKDTGFIRYHNEFHQLILVYQHQHEYRRRLLTSATCGECQRLAGRLAEHVKIDVKYYAG